jgi:hypothetical protein
MAHLMVGMVDQVLQDMVDWVVVVPASVLLLVRLHRLGCHQVQWECLLVDIQILGSIACHHQMLHFQVSIREHPLHQGFHLGECIQICHLTIEVVNWV